MGNAAPFLFDVTRLVWRRWAGRYPTGVDRVCLAYLRHFSRDAQAVVQHRRFRRILDSRSSAALFELLAEPNPSFKPRFVSQILASATRSRVAGEGRLYLNIGHTGLGEEGFRRWLREADVRPVYLVHDLIPITHPEFCRAGEGDRHRARMNTILTTATGVIGNSQATLASLASYARSSGLPQPPALAAWLGSTSLPRQDATVAPASRPTFVMLGTIEGRKNHLMVLHVWTRLVQKLGSRAPQLLIIGQRGWECEQAIDLIERSETLRGSVIEIGRCGDHELAGHLASARALLFPSLAEGFGLPLIEALSSGTPVIASDLDVFREIGQGIPDFLDPIDGPAWERMILAYAEEKSGAREAQIKRIAGYRAPTWEDHFSEVDRWLTAL